MSFVKKGLGAMLAVSLVSCVTTQPDTNKPADKAEIPQKPVTELHKQVIEQGREVSRRASLPKNQKGKVVRLALTPTETFTFMDINGLAVIDDMIIGETRDFVNPDGTFNRSAINSLEFRRWPLDIAYVIDTASYSNTIMPGIVKEAIKYWEANTVFRFHEKITDPSDPAYDPTKDLDWLVFTNGDGCSAWVGRQPINAGKPNEKPRGAHAITLEEASCQRHQAIHEIGHAVGLWHEHTRRDRLEFINVNKQFLDPTKDAQGISYAVDHNFDAKNDAFLPTEFDFESRMLYGNRSFVGTDVRDTNPPVKIKPTDNVISEKFGPNMDAPWDQNFINLSTADLEAVGEKYGYVVKPYPRNIIKNGTKCMVPSSTIPAGAPEAKAGNLIASGSPYSGTAIQAQNCPADTMIGTQHKWRIMPDSTFRGLAGKCLDAKDGVDADESAIVMTLCPRREITARSGSPRIADKAATATSPQVFGRPAIPKRAGVPAEKPKASQVWAFNSADGSIRGLGGKCLTMKAGTAAIKSLELRTCASPLAASQKWNVNEVSYKFPRGTPTP